MRKRDSENGHVSIGAPLGNPQGSSFTGDSESLIKRALETESFSLWELRNGNLEGASLLRTPKVM